ncbi:phosphotransferase enzyme family protein [Ornithinibacillus salinisoli]|uniref:Phosphotransferase enzyme family protein n=1 Tax=Ornithinibacillus salinisoli TaxID=1848459 RepID=A0ABW4VYQ0_9BACI
MMKLSTMKKVIDTVDRDWKSPLAERILERWGYDEGTVFCFRASANFIFMFKRAGKSYFLRFNDSCEKELKQIESELQIVQYLQDSSLKVSRPVKSNNENYIEVVNTESGTYYAVVFEALQGKQYEMEEINNEQIFRWGSSLGELHQTLKCLPDDLQKNRPNWQDHLYKMEELLYPSETAAYREVEKLSKWAEGLRVTKENYGIIHYDFELDNVMFENNTLGVLDFDDCSNYWYVADIVYALRGIEHFNVNNSVIKIFIEGYESETMLDRSILNEASGFVRMHHVVSLAKLTRAVDVAASTTHPEWLTHLHKKLSERIKFYRDSIGKVQN